jgi:excisionase family DNA binding protein
METTGSSLPTQRTYTVEQIAEILGVSVRKAYTVCETTSEIKTIRLGKRCLRIHKESFDNWFNEAGNTT